MTTNLITPSYVKELVELQENVILSPIRITTAQKLHIQPAIGRVTLDNLLNYITIGSPYIVTTPNYILWQLLSPALAWFTIYEFAPFLHYQMTENGILLAKSEQNEPISQEILEIIQTRYLQYANIYLNDVLAYIEANINQFPAYQFEFKTKDTERGKSIVLGGILFPKLDKDC